MAFLAHSFSLIVINLRCVEDLFLCRRHLIVWNYLLFPRSLCEALWLHVRCRNKVANCHVGTIIVHWTKRINNDVIRQIVQLVDYILMF